jgi:hypothetical protein
MAPLQSEKPLGRIDLSISKDKQITPYNHGGHPGGPTYHSG